MSTNDLGQNSLRTTSRSHGKIIAAVAAALFVGFVLGAASFYFALKSPPDPIGEFRPSKGMSMAGVKQELGQPDRYHSAYSDNTGSSWVSSTRTQKCPYLVEELGYGPAGETRFGPGNRYRKPRYRLELHFLEGRLDKWERN